MILNRFKYSPAFVTGFGAAVLTTIPGFKDFACCMLIPAAAILALYFDQKINRFESKISVGDAVLFGLFTGVFTAFFGTLFELIVTYLTHTHEIVKLLPQVEIAIAELNIGDAAENSINLMRNIAKEITENGYSIALTSLLLFSNLFIYILFGMMGGLIGLTLINKKFHNKEN
mgnify:FL=1